MGCVWEEILTDLLTTFFAWRVLSARSEKLLDLDLVPSVAKLPAVKPPGHVVVMPSRTKLLNLAAGDTVETVKLTLRLPKSDLEFAKQYAQAHRITVTELIDRYLRSLRAGLGPFIRRSRRSRG
jgi:hypothetical protein